MRKVIQSASIMLIVTAAITTASPARLEKLRPSKSRLLARQEVAEDIPAQTPYPPAGIKPAIPFNLPTDEKLVAPVNYYLPPLAAPANFNAVPAEVYGPPAETYGPPEVSVKDEVEEVANDEPEQSEEKPEEEKPEEEQPEETTPEEEQPEDEEPVEADQEESKEVAQQPQDIPVRGADADNDPEQEEDAVEVEPIAVEAVSNVLPERIILTKVNKSKVGKLRSAKLQLSPVVPLRRQALTAQPIFLVGGSLYSYNGQLFRL